MAERNAAPLGLHRANALTGSTPKISVELVTPEMAATWLGTMKGNRRLRKNMVDRYAREIIAGRWRLNGEAIKFGTDGRLVDGQHRLSAVIASKTAVTMTIVRGVDPDAVITLDTGAGRNFTDWSTIGNRAYGQMSGVVARWWALYEAGAITSRNLVPSMQELEDIIQRHPGIVESASFIMSCRTLKRRNASVLAFVHAYTSEVYAWELADLFMEELDSGVGLTLDSPVLALRRRLIDDVSPGKTVDARHALAWMIKAWNSWLAGEKVKRITWQPIGGDGTEAYPKFELRKPRDLEAARLSANTRRNKARGRTGE